MGHKDEQVVGDPQTVMIKHWVNLGRPVRNVRAFLATFFALEKSNSQSERSAAKRF